MKRVQGRVGPKSRVPGANAWEKEYALLLERLQVKGDIREWAYAPERLRLADDAWYKPDFRVIKPDGLVEFHEVKGFWREAARVRLKVAAALHPYRFAAVTKKQGNWYWETFWDGDDPHG